MSTSRIRVWILGLLVILYLVGVLLLSTLTLHDPRNADFNPRFNKNGQISKRDSFDFEALEVLRSPFRRPKLSWCMGDLRFLHPPTPPVALVSFPGSGNTWLRYLLQQATGVHTGSIYKDYGLLKNGFPAEHISNGSVLVVKTHEWGQMARTPFAKAVLLVRAPGPAILAEFNRQSGGHIGFATPDRYRKLRGKFWKQFVVDKLESWKRTNLDWLHNFPGPTHVVFYEELVDRTERTLKALLDFLEVSVPEVVINCTLERKEGIYRRRRRPLDFDPYKNEMKKLLEKEQLTVYDAIYTAALPTR